MPEPSDAAGKLACSIQEDRPKNASSERASLAPELKPAVVGEQKGEAKASIANVPSVLTLMREYAIFQQMLVSLVKSDEKVWVAVKERAEARPLHDRKAAHLMGCWYERAEDDMKVALAHYEAAADAGYGDAQFTLGHLYFTKKVDGVRNLQAAVRWWVRATKENDNADAWFTLGCVVKEGYDIHAYPELDSPVEFWIRAARQGHGPAQKRLRAAVADPSAEVLAALSVEADHDKHILT